MCAVEIRNHLASQRAGARSRAIRWHDAPSGTHLLGWGYHQPGGDLAAHAAAVLARRVQDEVASEGRAAVDAGSTSNGNRSLVISGRTLQVRLARDLVSARVCGAELHELLGMVAGEHWTPAPGAVPFGTRGRPTGQQQQQPLGYTTPVVGYTLRDAPALHGSPFSNNGALGGGGNVATSSMAAPSAAPQALTVRMQVPNESAGRIIGRGGSNIAEIRSRSGARVDIARHVPSQPVRDITIVGDHVQVQHAQMLIAAKMAEEMDVSQS